MPDQRGPWALDKVKARLRQEQVEREVAASERYRQKEPKTKEQTFGGTSLSNCVLFCFLLCFVLLAIAVLVLSAVVLSLTKRDNEKR